MVQVKRPLYWFHVCLTHGEVNAVMQHGEWMCPECKGPVRVLYMAWDKAIEVYTPMEVYPILQQEAKHTVHCEC